EPHPLPVQLLDLALERLDEEAHQAPHLVRGPSPVLAREGEERERLDVAPRALLDAHAHGLSPASQPARTRQRAHARPAPVAGAFSASCRSTFVISRRRCAVSGGMGMRITVPAVIGVSPRSDLKIAFSIACTTLFSHGEMTSVRPSSTAMLATCCSGTSEP